MIELFAISALLLWWLHRRQRRRSQAMRKSAIQILFIQNAIINVGRLPEPPTVKSPRYRIWKRS